MGEIVPFPTKKKFVSFQRLSKQECDAVLAVLIEKKLANYFSINDGGQYLSVFDSQGNPYFIGRERSVCYLFDPDETMLAQCQSFEDVLDTLEMTLKPTPDMPA
jgi:hypothetical protein